MIQNKSLLREVYERKLRERKPSRKKGLLDDQGSILDDIVLNDKLFFTDHVTFALGLTAGVPFDDLNILAFKVNQFLDNNKQDDNKTSRRTSLSTLTPTKEAKKVKDEVTDPKETKDGKEDGSHALYNGIDGAFKLFFERARQDSIVRGEAYKSLIDQTEHQVSAVCRELLHLGTFTWYPSELEFPKLQISCNFSELI